MSTTLLGDSAGEAAGQTRSERRAALEAQTRRSRRSTQQLPPTGQAVREPSPTWVRAGLGAVLAVATFLYFWDLNGVSLHPYYTAAVRGMSTDWHAFIFGSLDSDGTITVDKLPGALWLQALSVRVFGLHVWAVALPQAVMGVATIVVLFRVVRDWVGPVAGLLAAAALLVTPIAAALDRRNISDTLLTFLLVLAAAAALRATRSGHLRPLLACAVLVGLAFQAKMLQAWVLVPVFGGIYLYAAPVTSFVRRLANTVVAGVTTLLVSCAWVLLVWWTPAADRPYLDGTTGNNPFALVFGYNGISRFGSSDGSSLGAVAGTSSSRPDSGSGWGFLFSDTVAPQITWFLPVALIGLWLGIASRRGEPRTDGVRAGYLLWGGWLLISYLVFASSSGNHVYYAIVLAPAIAALSGAGAWICWQRYRSASDQREQLPLLLLISAALLWAGLQYERHSSFHVWLVVIVVLLGLGGIAALSFGRTWGVWLALAAALLSPAHWAFSVLDPLYAGSNTSPVAGPVGPAYRAAEKNDGEAKRPVSFAPPPGRYTNLLSYLTKNQGSAHYLVATQAAASAEPMLRGSDEPVLVMGGFTGLTPFPTTQAVAEHVQTGRLRHALLASNRPDSDGSRWISAHCTEVPQSAYGEDGKSVMTLFDCAKKP